MKIYRLIPSSLIGLFWDAQGSISMFWGSAGGVEKSVSMSSNLRMRLLCVQQVKLICVVVTRESINWHHVEWVWGWEKCSRRWQQVTVGKLVACELIDWLSDKLFQSWRLFRRLVMKLAASLRDDFMLNPTQLWTRFVTRWKVSLKLEGIHKNPRNLARNRISIIN